MPQENRYLIEALSLWCRHENNQHYYKLEPPYTECKGNNCHSFNSGLGQLKGPYSIYNMGSKLDSFLRKACFVFLFCSRRTAYNVRDNAKTFTLVGLYFKYVI